MEVEAALRTADEAKPPEQFADPVAVGSLIVSIAALAWQVCQGLKESGGKPTRDKLTHRIRAERHTHTELTATEEKVIEIISVETIRLSGETGDR